MTAELPDRMPAPRSSGWEADDLDHLPQAPRHTELIDGALIFVKSPQRSWHSKVMRRLTSALEQTAPKGFTVDQEITVRIDKKNRPEPDILVATAAYEGNRTWYACEDVALAVEVVSEESVDRDRFMKPIKYARAGITHFWRVEEEEDGAPVVHVYELDVATGNYVPTGIHRERLKLSVPFPLDIDLAALYS
ncbi:Uma2 family endonuclease [Streptomyces sp. S6]